jgi:hypothetical protein
MGVPNGYNTMPIENIIGKDDADNGFDSTLVAANKDGSVMERIEDLKDQGRRCVVKALAAADLTGSVTRFTVTGVVRVLNMGLLVTTALPAGANTLKASFTPTGGDATDLSGATDTASAAAQQLFVVDGVAATGLVKTTAVGIAVLANIAHMPIILGPGVIQTIFSAGPPATGAGSLFVEYEPLTPGSLIG